MGSGASNLTAEQRVEITQRMEKVYALCTADNLEPDIIQSNMVREYNDAIAKIMNIASPRLVQGSTQSKKVNTSSKKKPTRRRSFDTSLYSAKKKPIANGGLVTNIDTNSVGAGGGGSGPAEPDLAEISKSMTSLMDLPVENADNWDSVTQQPFCHLCQMAFKSVGFLERHINYSSVHANAERKLKGVAESEVKQPVLPPPIEEPKSPGPVPKQEEGVHYKPIYSGTKLYWRTQKSIDFNFYHHILPGVIEVIAFDSEKHKELNRIYLDYETIIDITAPKVVEGMAAKERENDTERQRDRFFQFPQEKMREHEEELKRTSMITFILQRIQLQSLSVENASISTGVSFVRLSVDEFIKEPLLATVPVILVPVTLTRRRRTNAEDHHNIMKSLSNDHDAINCYLNSAASNTNNSGKLPRPRKTSSVDIAIKAERIASIMHSFVNTISAAAEEQRKYRVVQKKWTKAIKRVIRIKQVADTARVIERFVQAGSPSLVGPFSSPKVRRSNMSPITIRKNGVVPTAIGGNGKGASFTDLATAQDDNLAEKALRGDASAKSPVSTSFKKRIASQKAAMVN